METILVFKVYLLIFASDLELENKNYFSKEIPFLRGGTTWQTHEVREISTKEHEKQNNSNI